MAGIIKVLSGVMRGLKGLLLSGGGWLRRGGLLLLYGRARGLAGRALALAKVRRMLAFGAALVLAFWLGSGYSPSSQNLPDIKSLDGKVRELAKEQIAHSQENEQLRAQLALRDAEVAQLTAENRDLVSDILRRDETILTYRQIIDAEGGQMVIHALAEDPGFASGRRRLSAVLVRSKSGTFKGAYYFEIVSIDNGIESALRAPQQPAKLDFQRYREITESINLPDDARIVKMRLIVADAKGRVIASDEAFFGGGENDGENGGGENDNDDNGGGGVE